MSRALAVASLCIFGLLSGCAHNYGPVVKDVYLLKSGALAVEKCDFVDTGCVFCNEAGMTFQRCHVEEAPVREVAGPPLQEQIDAYHLIPNPPRPPKASATR